MPKRHTVDLWDLRAERMSLLRQLNGSSNAKRQTINKQLQGVSKQIQSICGLTVGGSGS